MEQDQQLGHSNILKQLFQFRTNVGEKSAEENSWLDQSVPENHYNEDESSVRRFNGLVYSTERAEWVARFLPVAPERTTLEHSEGTYAQVLRFARTLHDCHIRPSESAKAILAFSVHVDAEARKLLEGMASQP